MTINDQRSSLSELDKEILNTVQNDFPLNSRPFREMARQVGLDETEFLLRLKKLKEKGFIRRLGGVFDSKKLGFKSTLVALRVSPEKLEEVAEKVNALEGVTHNYQRDHFFNLWFTLVAPSLQELKKTLSVIENYTGVERLNDFPAIKLFKIGVNFEF